MEAFSLLLPIVVMLAYAALLWVVVKTALYISRLPRRLNHLEQRIKQLEEKEGN